jgi:hypothetical protein
MPSFRSLADLQLYAQRFGLSIEHEELILHDLDAVAHWLKTPRKDTVDCCEFLAAWNLFEDIASSVEGKRPPPAPKHKRISNKLFWGNNLPSLTPPGKHYVPIWTKSEVGKLQHILSNGLRLFRNTRREGTSVGSMAGSQVSSSPSARTP